MSKSKNKSKNYEPGMEISLLQIEGTLFECSPILLNFTEHMPIVSKKRFLAITNTQIIDLAPHPSKRNYATSLETHNLESLAKLKFRRGELISFQFKNDRIVKYRMTNSSECVDHIKMIMMKMGIKGQQKTGKAINNVTTAEGLLEKIENLTNKFSASPSHALVEEVMSLLREAVEKFSEAGDMRFQHIIVQIQEFLQREDVVRILGIESSAVLESEVERHLSRAYQITDEEDKIIENMAEQNEDEDMIRVALAGAAPSSESDLMEQELSVLLTDWTAELDSICDTFVLAGRVGGESSDSKGQPEEDCDLDLSFEKEVGKASSNS
eukprot:gene207-375_t